MWAFFCLAFQGHAQRKYASSTDIYEDLEKLNFLGSVLYIAAHPDDENTKIIAYMVNEVHARTAYLSLTRGSGGQNLIGKEIGGLLGVLRSEELLSARSVDGGEQFFTSAVDFGFSKTPEETFNIWDKKQTLEDMVRIIREFRPDVIINRFDHRTSGNTHGHHTASAILSVEAFEKAGDEHFVPDVSPWKPTRQFFNTSVWAYNGKENFDRADKRGFNSLEMGTYYPRKGVSNTEISALSRSYHRCQGFGTEGTRGSDIEYLEPINGKKATDTTNVFSGIDTSWSRIEGGKAIGDILYQLQNQFNFKEPARHIPQLLEAYRLIRNLKDPYWKKIKEAQIKKIIKECSGLFFSAKSDESSAVAGSIASVTIEAVNRSEWDIRLKSLVFQPKDQKSIDEALENNKPYISEVPMKIPSNTPYTSPYWLLSPNSIGSYKIEDKSLIGLARTPKLSVTFVVDISGVEVAFPEEVVYSHVDPILGEVRDPFVVTPPVTIKFSEKNYLFTKNIPEQVSVTVTSGQNWFSGVLSLSMPKEWQIQPKQVPINLENKGDQKEVIFSVIPPKKPRTDPIVPVMSTADKEYSLSRYVVKYEHIEKKEVLMPATATAIKFDIKKDGNRVGYIEGAGDNVPESLRQIGYEVDIISRDEINLEYLKTFDAIVMGIRAYNVLEDFENQQKILLEYVRTGGTMIVQYNTLNNLSVLSVQNFSPYYISISNDRVVEENAPVKFLAPRHPILNRPNKIEEADFKGWVQERGLYFPNQWDNHFTAILSMNDSGESPKKGALLVTPYGEGNYIYTGLSFFRELPVGVTGAYKLFANMISLGNGSKNKE